MAISVISSNHDFSNITALKPSASDTSSKTLQNQLANTEQRLNRLSSDSKISAEEKAKERQELQKQIAELNRKLQLLQLEKEEEQKKAQKEQEQKAALQKEMLSDTILKNSSITKDTLTDPHKIEEVSKDAHETEESEQAIKEEHTKPELATFSSQDVQKMLIANSRLQKDRMQNQVIHQKEHTEHILESEIKMDAIHGNENTFKQKQLEAFQSKPAFEIEALNAPKQPAQNNLSISDKTKVIVVE